MEDSANIQYRLQNSIVYEARVETMKIILTSLLPIVILIAAGSACINFAHAGDAEILLELAYVFLLSNLFPCAPRAADASLAYFGGDTDPLRLWPLFFFRFRFRWRLPTTVPLHK